MAANCSAHIHDCIADASEPGELNGVDVVFGLQTAMRRRRTRRHWLRLSGQQKQTKIIVMCTLTTEEQVSIRSGNYAAVCVLEQQWCASPGQAGC